MRRPVTIAVGLVVAAVVWAAPAEADSTVVVRGLDFPEGSTGLSIASCTGMFDAVDEPVTTYLSRSPDAPAGTRSLKYDLAGGNAVGSQHRVASMAATTVAGLSLHAAEGATGVAYAAFQAPAERGTSLLWVGRAELDEAPGGWRAVDAVALTYTWTQYDLGTRQAASAAEAPLTVAEFVAEHGDGPGLFSVGFGCDGRPFKVDALRLGSAGDVTTYDLEGFTSTTTMTGSATRIVAGDPVTLEGSLRDTHGNPLPHGLLILEAQPYGAHGFTPVDGAAEPVGGGDPRVTVHPDARTVYRWRFVGTWSVDGSISATFTVEVGSVVSATVESGVGDGGPLVITGRATPGRPRGSATLSHLGADGRSVVATIRIGADGTFRFEVRGAAPGQYVVGVPAGDGNLGGESAVLVVAPSPSSDPTPTPSVPESPAATSSPTDAPTGAPTATPSAAGSGSASPTP